MLREEMLGMNNDMIKEGKRLWHLAGDLEICLDELSPLEKEKSELESSIEIIKAQGPYAEIRKKELKEKLLKETSSDFIASIEGGKRINSLLKSLQCVDIANHLDTFLDQWENDTFLDQWVNTEKNASKLLNTKFKPLGCVLTGILALLSMLGVPLIVGMFDEDFVFNHVALLMLGPSIFIIVAYFTARKLNNNRRRNMYEKKCALWENSYKQFINSNSPYFNSISIDEAQVKKEAVELADACAEANESIKKLNSQIEILIAKKESLISETEEKLSDIDIYDEIYGKVVWGVQDLFAISDIAMSGAYDSWDSVIAAYQKTDSYNIWRYAQGKKGPVDSIWK